MEEILDALQRETGDPDWAAETRATLLTKSPTSLRITLRQLVLGQGLDLEDALKLEYRMTQHVMAAHDFYEGIRAVLIDKDQKPRWQPATLGEIDEAATQTYFAPLEAGELTFD
jgi:enoyl-CoA hydratase